MNIRTMRLLDRWAGVPLCLSLTLARRMLDRWRHPAPPPADLPTSRGSGESNRHPATPPCRILLVKLAEMGSTVLALPAIARLRELYPNARLHYLCFDENRAVLDVLPGVTWEGVHTIRTTSLWTLIADTLRVLRELRRLEIDIAIDLEIFSRASAALVFLSAARTRVGFHRFRAEGSNCGDLFTHRLTYNSHLHTAGAFLALAEASSTAPDDVPLLKRALAVPARLPRFEPPADMRETVLAKLAERGYPRGTSPPIVILNANASDLLPLRRWPMERFEELARRCLAFDDRLWIVLTGAPSETQVIDALARRIGRERVVSMAGATTLAEVVTLYGLARVMVTNDSGPAHFAALTPVKIISLFGPETPALYRPLSAGNLSITAHLACSPCINVFNARDTACANNQCMQAITVDQVFEVFRESYNAADVDHL